MLAGEVDVENGTFEKNGKFPENGTFEKNGKFPENGTFEKNGKFPENGTFEKGGWANSDRKFVVSNRVNILLFVLTIGTTLVAGTRYAGVKLPKDIIRNLHLGISFSFTLLSILLFHEFAHYFTAKFHKASSTLPYFIPAPTFLGTMGAIIRMKSPLPHKTALFDVGIAGPLASFTLSIVATALGLSTSPVVDTIPEEGGYLGSSIIFSVIFRVVKGPIAQGHYVDLNAVAFGGWIGFFITAMNLLPVGQLDGGHIAYSLFGKWHALVARIAVLVLLGFGLFWPGWLIWAALIIILVGLRHPPPVDDITPINKKRKLLGIFALFILIISFVPVPFVVVGG